MCDCDVLVLSLGVSSSPVERYASWMRSLTPLYPVTVSDDVFRQLSFATSGGPVCPQLQHLTWKSSYGWKNVQQFLSPRLVSILFREDEWEPKSDPALITTISLLPTTYLEELTIYISPPPTPIHYVISEVVQRLSPRFRRLTARFPLSEAAWERLATLPKLEWLRVSDTPRTEISKSMPHENTFPALKRMEIAVDNVHHQPFLFSLLKSSPLRELIVAGSGRIRGVDVPGQVTAAILGAGLQRSIDTLIFSGFDHTNVTFLSHLGPFGSLQVLSCVTDCRWSEECISPLTDSDIERLVRGLPQLATLHLGHWCTYDPHNATIKSLISLSSHCLSLGELSLPCDLTNISEDVKTESGEPDPRLMVRSPCKLWSLNFRWVAMPPPDDVEVSGIVASAFRHLFPLLSLKGLIGAV